MAAAASSRVSREAHELSPPRRSLLREVLSEAELTELGLDASADDSPTVPPSLSRKRFHALFLLSGLWILLYWSSLLALLLYIHPETRTVPPDLPQLPGVYVHPRGAGGGGGQAEGVGAETAENAGEETPRVEARRGFYQQERNADRRAASPRGSSSVGGDQSGALRSNEQSPSSSPSSLSPSSFLPLETVRGYTTAAALHSVSASESESLPETFPRVDEFSFASWIFLVLLSGVSMAAELCVLSLLRSFAPATRRAPLLVFPLASAASSSALLSTSLTLLLDFFAHICQLGDVLFLFAVAPPLFPLPLFLCALYTVSVTSFFFLLLQLRSLLAVFPRDAFALHDGPAGCLSAPVAACGRPLLLLWGLRVLVAGVLAGLRASLCWLWRLLTCLVAFARGLSRRVAAVCRALRPAPPVLAPLGAQRRLFRRGPADCCEGDTLWGEPGDREQSLLPPGSAVSAYRHSDSESQRAGRVEEQAQVEEKQDVSSLPRAAASPAVPGDEEERLSLQSFASSSRVSARPSSGRGRQDGRASGGILQQVLHGFLQAKRPHAERAETRVTPTESPQPASRVSLLAVSRACSLSSTSFSPSGRGSSAESSLNAEQMGSEAEAEERKGRGRREGRDRERRDDEGGAARGDAGGGEEERQRVEEERRFRVETSGEWRERENEETRENENVDGNEVMKLTNHFLLLDMAAAADTLKTHFLPAEKLEAFEFGASLLSLSRFYLGDLCLLFFLAYAVCAFGSASLPLALLLLHFVKILLQTLLFILKSDASLWELWCYDLE
ncbi:hypothetical protein TGGT1_217340 [Toxoplasma gondii GT1]|uniref:Transmembrane protein n=2 Tax=Toxoplasma gondii TaxID=5811 RepID=S7WA83_TOXGG|nr:hypothetical protein TGGT1_217340 [Toxoplasma gondii GT1]KAF4638316.1 hypothetical protein TGRH88_059230 [Toxoplasma gondii]